MAGLALALFLVPFGTPANAQQLVNKGILVTQIMARTRFGVFERGDLVHVTVRQPAGNKGFTLSVHAEYKDPAGKWQQVPPPKTMLAALYTSGNYGGLRDYVDVNGVSEATERNITCFMPYDGFALEQGRDCTFRYVVRLWEPRRPHSVDDKEIGHLALDTYRIHVGHDSEGILISTVYPMPSAFLVSERGTPAAQHAGIVRFFDTSTGKWELPEKPSSTEQVSARR
jgi:hypothetical protein